MVSLALIFSAGKVCQVMDTVDIIKAVPICVKAEFAGEIVEKMPKTKFSRMQKIGVRPIGLTPKMYVLKLPD